MTKKFGLKVVNDLPEAKEFRRDMDEAVETRIKKKAKYDEAKAQVASQVTLRKWNDPILQGEPPESLQDSQLQQLSAEVDAQDNIIRAGNIAWSGSSEWSPTRPMVGELSARVCKDPWNLAKLLVIVEKLVASFKHQRELVGDWVDFGAELKAGGTYVVHPIVAPFGPFSDSYDKVMVLDIITQEHQQYADLLKKLIADAEKKTATAV
jgi:hypothetical protein